MRIVIVSNRLPVTVNHDADGRLTFRASAGGLATGLASLTMERLWIGWPGTAINDPVEQKTVICVVMLFSHIIRKQQ